MNPGDLIHDLRIRSTELKRSINAVEVKNIIEKFMKEREEIYSHKKSRPTWIPKNHRVTKTDIRDSEPTNFYGNLYNAWGCDELDIQPISYKWKPAKIYFTEVSNRANIPNNLRRGIYSIFLSELGHFFIKELQDKIWKQHRSIITLEMVQQHKEASEDPSKKVLIDTSEYINNMQLSFGARKLTLTVEHQRYAKNTKITYLQLAKILEFGTSRMPPYSHWRKLKNLFDGGESKLFMKTFLHMYLDIPREVL